MPADSHYQMMPVSKSDKCGITVLLWYQATTETICHCQTGILDMVKLSDFSSDPSKKCWFRPIPTSNRIPTSQHWCQILRFAWSSCCCPVWEYGSYVGIVSFGDHNITVSLGFQKQICSIYWRTACDPMDLWAARQHLANLLFLISQASSKLRNLFT